MDSSLKKASQCVHRRWTKMRRDRLAEHFLHTHARWDRTGCHHLPHPLHMKLLVRCYCTHQHIRPLLLHLHLHHSHRHWPHPNYQYAPRRRRRLVLRRLPYRYCPPPCPYYHLGHTDYCSRVANMQGHCMSARERTLAAMRMMRQHWLRELPLLRRIQERLYLSFPCLHCPLLCNKQTRNYQSKTSMAMMKLPRVPAHQHAEVQTSHQRARMELIDILERTSRAGTIDLHHWQLLKHPRPSPIHCRTCQPHDRCHHMRHHLLRHPGRAWEEDVRLQLPGHREHHSSSLPEDLMLSPLLHSLPLPRSHHKACYRMHCSQPHQCSYR